MKLSDLNRKLEENPEYLQAKNELDLHFALANAVLRARLQKGWSQSELARAIGTKQANISRIEAGLGNPTLRLINKLAQVLNFEVHIHANVPAKALSIFTTTTPVSSTSDVIRVLNWPALSLPTKYRAIYDKSAEGEGYLI